MNAVKFEHTNSKYSIIQTNSYNWFGNGNKVKKKTCTLNIWKSTIIKKQKNGKLISYFLINLKKNHSNFDNWISLIL